MKNYHILKNYADKIFLCGFGNFWYEENEIGDDGRILYKVFGTLLLSMFGFMTIMEIIAGLIGKFPDDETSDCRTFSVSHTIVMIKMFSIITKKSFIKNLNHRMVTVGQNYEQEPLMAEKYKTMKINVIGYFGVVYGSCAFFIFEGLRKAYAGSHFVTVVTYYPPFEDDSVTASSVRVITTIVLLIMMIVMITSVDSFTMVYIIMYKYKFITLRHYFEQLRFAVEKLLESGEKDLAAEKLADGLIEGIKMHSNLLKLSKEIDKAFGTVMALQLCQSSGSAVSILLQIALTEDLQFAAAAKLIFFVIALFFLLGLFLCNAGEITHQASLISDAIFYSGWSLFPPRLNEMCKRNIRQLVLLAMVQAQRPLVMKAFKMLELTYATFILVVRGTYSVFALFYAQNK